MPRSKSRNIGRTRPISWGVPLVFLDGWNGSERRHCRRTNSGSTAACAGRNMPRQEPRPIAACAGGSRTRRGRRASSFIERARGKRHRRNQHPAFRDTRSKSSKTTQQRAPSNTTTRTEAPSSQYECPRIIQGSAETRIKSRRRPTPAARFETRAAAASPPFGGFHLRPIGEQRWGASKLYRSGELFGITSAEAAFSTPRPGHSHRL